MKSLCVSELGGELNKEATKTAIPHLKRNGLGVKVGFALAALRQSKAV